VVWSLSASPAGAGGLHVLPASHTCGLPCPSAVRTGEHDLTSQPVLGAGDCVLMSSNLAWVSAVITTHSNGQKGVGRGGN
jgi:hypothetical protein